MSTPVEGRRGNGVRTWLVLANAAHARVLEQGDAGWQPVADLLHAESRMKASQLGDDRPGHVEGTGHGLGSASYQPRSNPHEHEHDRFAREVAALLDRGIADRRCAGIVLCASNPFLGKLNASLSARASQAVLRTVPSDYTALPDDEAARRLGL